MRNPAERMLKNKNWVSEELEGGFGIDLWGTVPLNKGFIRTQRGVCTG